jgi:HrpA-like RNA helicase
LEKYPTPEIQRTLLDHNYLRILSTTGLKMEELEFFHQPPKDLIEKAKNTLNILGAIDEQNQVTQLGKQLSSLPVDVNTGRMIVESLKYGVVDDILKIAAIKQVDGIIARNATLNEEIQDEDSDLLTQLNLFNYGRNLQGIKINSKEQEKLFDEAGIFRKKYFMAQEQYRNLKDSMYPHMREYRPANSLSAQEKKEALLKCITAGMLDALYKREYGEYKDRNDDERQKGKESTINGHKVVVAKPKNIQFRNRR